jgi:polyhydroxyalkanoate synthesis regulator phasin
MPKKKRGVALEDLAQTMNQSFGELEKNINKRFDQAEMKFKGLEDGQDQIIMKLSNVAYRFEVKELEARISVLEDRVIQLGRKKK